MNMAIAAPITNQYGFGFGFVQLSPTVFYRAPLDGVKPSRASITSEPSLILLSAWMNASPSHVAKYATGYQKIFPSSSVLLITTSTMNFLAQSMRQRLKELSHALDLIKILHSKEKVLLHSFSNGGAHATWLLAKAYRAQTGQNLPICKAIFDSAPGNQEYQSTLAAFFPVLPKNAFARAVVSGILRILLRSWFVYMYLIGREKILDTARRGLNDTLLIPRESIRLYVYSTMDDLIRWQDVESHAREAEAQGFKVRMVKYLNSGHAAHMLQDEKRYWNAVIGLWDSDYLSSPGSVASAW